MSTADYTVGQSVPGGYGTSLRQPTGTGLPNYDPARFSTTPPPPPLLGVEWCDKAGCPRHECHHCRRAEREERMAANEGASIFE